MFRSLPGKVSRKEPSTTAGGKVLQVVHTSKTDTFTSTSTSFVDITGMSLSITLAATANKVLLTCNLVSETAAATESAYVKALRDSTDLDVGATAGSRVRAAFNAANPGSVGQVPVAGSMTWLDSPSSVSTLTYKLQMRLNTASTFYLNRSGTDTDNASFGRFISTLTAMEIEG